MDPILSPHVPELFITLTQRFGLLLAGGFAIMTVTSLDKLGPRRGDAAELVMLEIINIPGTDATAEAK